jgi:hypothetical protein
MVMSVLERLNAADGFDGCDLVRDVLFVSRLSLRRIPSDFFAGSACMLTWIGMFVIGSRTGDWGLRF